MTIQPFVFFGLVAVVVVLFGTVFYLILSRGRKDPVQSRDVLTDAEREAEDIVKSSVEKAQETLMDAQYIKDDLMRSIETSMRSIAESAIVSFQEETQKTHVRFQGLFEEIEKKYMSETEKSVVALDREAEMETKGFREALQKEIVASQQKADARAEEAYQKVLSELEDYKRRKMEELDGQVRDMVERVFSEVLGKSLTGSEHEKLVVDALEDAKKSGMLGAKEYKPVSQKN